MLTKCANPACCVAFRYLHEGKLFLFDHPDESQLRHLPDGEFGGKVVPVRYYWLCGTCCRTMTVVLEDGTMRVIPVEQLRRAA